MLFSSQAFFRYVAPVLRRPGGLLNKLGAQNENSTGPGVSSPESDARPKLPVCQNAEESAPYVTRHWETTPGPVAKLRTDPSGLKVLHLKL